MRLFKRNKKPLVVTIHGFGKNRSSEMDNMCAFLKEHGYDTLQFDIYDLENGLDADWKEWLRRCERQMHEALGRNPRIILVGFSMGGVIATHLATVYKVEKLVLVAPAFKSSTWEVEAGDVNSRTSRPTQRKPQPHHYHPKTPVMTFKDTQSKFSLF